MVIQFAICLHFFAMLSANNRKGNYYYRLVMQTGWKYFLPNERTAPTHVRFINFYSD